MSEALETSMMFVHVWSEATLRHVERVREARREHGAMSRLLDREWNDALADEESVLWRRLWAEEHELVWAANQLENWATRYAAEGSKEAPPSNRTLAILRNALEHLVEADLSQESVAMAGEGRGNWSLRKLAGEQILLATGGRELFENLDLDEVDDYAREHLEAVQTDLSEREEAALEAAVDAHIGQLTDERRGK